MAVVPDLVEALSGKMRTSEDFEKEMEERVERAEKERGEPVKRVPDN